MSIFSIFHIYIKGLGIAGLENESAANKTVK